MAPRARAGRFLEPAHEPREARDHAAAVFLGRPIHIVERPFPILPVPTRADSLAAYTEWALNHFTVTIEVDRVWKGPVGREREVVAGSHPGACSVAFELGKEYLVYAHRDRGRWYTSICTRSRRAQRAEIDFAELGPGRSPLSPAPDSSRPPHN